MEVQVGTTTPVVKNLQNAVVEAAPTPWDQARLDAFGEGSCPGTWLRHHFEFSRSRLVPANNRRNRQIRQIRYSEWHAGPDHLPTGG